MSRCGDPGTEHERGAASRADRPHKTHPIEERSMQRLTVWRFDTPSGADDAVKTLELLFTNMSDEQENALREAFAE
jgi:hypothetical protein